MYCSSGSQQNNIMVRVFEVVVVVLVVTVALTEALSIHDATHGKRSLKALNNGEIKAMLEQTNYISQLVTCSNPNSDRSRCHFLVRETVARMPEVIRSSGRSCHGCSNTDVIRLRTAIEFVRKHHTDDYVTITNNFTQ
ncbi:hypothetical protein Pmani_025102 [Petrolisthes manimaculis]|uniref:Uncharacterized protein n=1 Tax=Petrolisthes manimaculis TaxID=1843537 RepID=A0AAE1P8M6_9EUCA|nr:hypothetical protein Pmani_025102 [Petrolisthes manimaculis]